MKKRKKIICSITAVVVMFAIAAVLLSQHKQSEKKNKQITDLVSLDEIDQINIRNNGTGNVKEITDTETIESLKAYIKSLKLKWTDMEPSTGTQYSILLYKGEDLESQIIFVNSSLISMEEGYYEITGSNGFELSKFVPDSRRNY